MATPFPFVTGAVLEAAELNAITELPIADKTASYVLVAADSGKRVIMNSASATTITVNNSLFSAGQMVFIANKGAGTCTVTAGAGVTVNVNGSLAVTQYGGGTLLALSASSFVFFPGSVVNTFAVEYALIGGGGGGGRQQASSAGGGGGAGALVTGTANIGRMTHTITVGAGGSGSTADLANGFQGSASGVFGATANGGGGGAGFYSGSGGASGGGSILNNTPGGQAISGQGNNGGIGSSSAGDAGGGGGSAGTGGNGTGGTTGGAGGTAGTNNYTGSSISYSGGGGGAGSTTGGTGGTNAGNGAGGAGVGGNATANRGGGGGGSYGANNGGNGGSGRVIVRWLTTAAAGFTITTTGSPTTGTDGSYTWYAWDSTGTLVVA